MCAFQKILVAADFSEGSCESFRVACALAREGETRVVVLYVAEPMYVAAEPAYFGEQTAQFSIVERDPAYYGALRDRLREAYAPDHPLVVDYGTRVGAAAEEILRAAGELEADLIVLGTHGRTGLRRLLAGSVAEAVLRRAPCPVLALRSGGPGLAVIARFTALLAPLAAYSSLRRGLCFGGFTPRHRRPRWIVTNSEPVSDARFS